VELIVLVGLAWGSLLVVQHGPHVPFGGFLDLVDGLLVCTLCYLIWFFGHRVCFGYLKRRLRCC
jgi:hypothetical protein